MKNSNKTNLEILQDKLTEFKQERNLTRYDLEESLKDFDRKPTDELEAHIASTREALVAVEREITDLSDFICIPRDQRS